MTHVVQLSQAIGPRPAGTNNDMLARDYLRKTLEEYGYVVTLQEFPFDSRAFRPARIDVAGIGTTAYALSGSPAGTAAGQLVAAGIGRPEDFLTAVFPPGAVALIERGQLTFSEKTDNAVAAGATGVIVYNNEEGAFQGELRVDATVPVVSISRELGQDLLAQLASAPQATVTVTAAQGVAYNVVARPRGAATCETLTGGHYDSVPVAPGADDNASGTAAVLELARVVSIAKPAGTHCFALFGAEEIGLLGSRAYLQEISAGDIRALRYMINLDVVGVDTDTLLVGSDGLIEVARIAAQKLAIPAEPGSIGAASSDHASFQDRDVPVLMLTRPDVDIHTPNDGVPRIRPKSLEDTVRLALAVLQAA